jgi:hypothetical protein
MDAEERFEPAGGRDGGMKNIYCILYKYYSEYKIKKDNLGKICSIHDL